MGWYYSMLQDPSDPSDENYMLVMQYMDTDLRNYLQQNHNTLTWNKRIKIIVDIIDALLRIHKEEAIHRDLHSGNILYLKGYDYWYISDLGFCGPVKKPIKSIYGNLPYIAPEVISKKEYTYASDIYSIGMLMWEISSGQPPFADFDHNYNLIMKIINGMRPKIVSGTPSEYKILMEKCWYAISSKKTHINSISNEIYQIQQSYNQNENNEYSTNIYNSQLNTNLSINVSSSINSSVRN